MFNFGRGGQSRSGYSNRSGYAFPHNQYHDTDRWQRDDEYTHQQQNDNHWQRLSADESARAGQRHGQHGSSHAPLAGLSGRKTDDVHNAKKAKNKSAVGRHPPGLRGREIGMFYAKKAKENNAETHLTEAHIPLDRLVHLEEELATLLDEHKQENVNTKSYHLDHLKKNIEGNRRIDELYRRSESQSKKLPPDPPLPSNPLIPQSDASNDFLLREPEVVAKNRIVDERLMSKGKSSSSLQLFRKRLPAADKRQQILGLIESHQVVVITGETGCGKTTQVPQFILENCLGKEGLGACKIVVTQPRRISAISVSERISEERGESLGGSVGFQIRLESKLPNQRNSILLCTTGVVLQWLQSSPTLNTITHLILDEVHERDVDSDFLMTICKRILPMRPDLKLILMSATLDAGKFSQFFKHCPSIHIPGFTYPVEDIYLEDILNFTQYRKEFKPGQRGKKSQKRRDEYEKEMGAYLRHIASTGKYSKSTLEFLSSPDSEEVDMDLAANVVQYIHHNEDAGAILVFLPGWEQIAKLNDLLDNSATHRLQGNTVIFPLHSLMPTASQRAIFSKPAAGTRKIILATNIAETSITIDDVVYVVDCGKIKIKQFDVASNISTLQPEWAGLANVRQRRGRAGRVQPGKCYHLFTTYRNQLLPAYLPPEVCRIRLDEVILKVKLLQLGSCTQFLKQLLDPPSEEMIALSVELLETINAVTVVPLPVEERHHNLAGSSVRRHWKTEELTPLGFHLAQLPLDPQTGKMILMGAIFSCLDPVLSVAASLSFKDAFLIPLGKTKQVDAVKIDFGGPTKSDHLMLANVITEYYLASNKSNFCWENFISESVIKELMKVKVQLARHLYAKRFLTCDNYMDDAANVNSNDESLVRAVICAGLYPNVAKIKKVKKNEHMDTVLVSSNDKRILFHPKSILVNSLKFPYPWVVYHLKQKSSQTYLFDATVVSPLSLLFFGCTVKTGQEKVNGRIIETVSADKFITFNCEKRTASLVARTRLALDLVIERTIKHPSPTSWTSIDGRVLKLIVRLLNTELTGLQFDGTEG